MTPSEPTPALSATTIMAMPLLNGVGDRISIAVAGRLAAYDAEPSRDRWHDVHDIYLQPHMTVWQAWSATDPTAPRRGLRVDKRGKILKDWTAWPTREQFRAALAFAARSLR